MAEAAAPKHKTTQSESYVSFEPLYTSIVEAGRPCGMLMVHFGLDVPDPKLREEIQRSAPVLRDAYLRNLIAFTSNQVQVWRQPDIDVIAARLQRITDRAVQRPGARILMAQMAMRITR